MIYRRKTVENLAHEKLGLEELVLRALNMLEMSLLELELPFTPAMIWIRGYSVWLWGTSWEIDERYDTLSERFRYW